MKMLSTLCYTNLHCNYTITRIQGYSFVLEGNLVGLFLS